MIPSLSQQIEQHAASLPEGAPLCPSALLHLGNRAAAVDQALSRLARRGRLIRACQGVYMRPIETRFGARPPAIEKVIASLSRLWGEVMVPCGGAAANALGLTTQVPLRPVYLTSGPNRRLRLCAQTVHLGRADAGRFVFGTVRQGPGLQGRHVSVEEQAVTMAGFPALRASASRNDFFWMSW